MNRHRFTLETVLEIRRTQETAAQQELANALQEQAVALGHWQDAMTAREQWMQRPMAGPFSAAERQHHWSVQQTQERHCLSMRAAHQQAETVAGEKRALYLVARRNRELLDKLKTTRREAAAREAALTEQNLFDELAMTSRHRATVEAASL